MNDTPNLCNYSYANLIQVKQVGYSIKFNIEYNNINMIPFTLLNILVFFAAPIGFCLIASYMHPGFCDVIPWFLLLIISIPVVVFWTVGVISIHYLSKRSMWFQSLIKRFYSTRIKQCLFISSVMLIVVFLSLMAIASWINHSPVSTDKPQLVILGLDGATWDLINPMMAKGQLPNIQQLCQEGVHGNLQSLEPMQSPIVWTSIATGLPTDQHGINGYFSTRSDLSANRVFDICARNNLKVGLFSWLVTWPPRDPFAFNIPSWMAHSPDTRPMSDSCIQELYLEQSRYGGPINPVLALWDSIKRGARLRGVERMAQFYLRDYIGYSEEERLAAKLMAEAQIRADLYISLLKRHQPDISAFILYGSDKIAHRFWHYMQPEKFPDFNIEPDNPYKDAITDYYREADRQFGRILETLPESTTVILISDHGFQADPAAPRQFFVDVPRLLNTLGSSQLLHHYMIQRQIVLEPIMHDVEFIKDLQQQLTQIQFADDNEPVFIVEVEDNGKITLRANFSLSWNPESPVLTNKSIIIQEKEYPVDQFFFERTFSGTHHPTGIIIAQGPSIQPGAQLQPADLLDLAPTMLYQLGMPISKELPGRIMDEIFTDSFRSTNKPIYVEQYDPPAALPDDSESMPESLMEQLRSLNYVK